MMKNEENGIKKNWALADPLDPADYFYPILEFQLKLTIYLIKRKNYRPLK